MISIRPITLAAFLCLATKAYGSDDLDDTIGAHAFRIHHLNSQFCWDSGSQLKVGELDCMHENGGICRDDWIFGIAPGIHKGVKLWYGLDHPSEIPLNFDNLPGIADYEYIFNHAKSLCISEPHSYNTYSTLQVGDSDCYAKLECPSTGHPVRLKVPDGVYHVNPNSDEEVVVKFRNDAGRGMMEISNKGNIRWNEYDCHWSTHCPDKPACNENGYEVWKVQPNENFGLKLETTVDTNECTYELELSFKPDESLPFLSGPTKDDLIGIPQEEFDSICAAEGFDETQTPSILSPADHVGLNTYYTDYATSIELSERAAGKVGFKLATLGASPCGTFLQPFPQYSIHFYTIDTAGREELKCFSDGGYFCKTIDEQCTDSGRKMNMDTGGPLCAVQDPGFPNAFPLFENLPRGYAWTLDGNDINGINAATPAMGLHAVDPLEFLPDRDVKIPYLLQLNYDQQVIGNHILLWSGFAEGEGSNDYEKNTTNYNCQTADKMFLPTNTQAKYNEDTGRTSVIITGPLKDCTGESFTEVLY